MASGSGNWIRNRRTHMVSTIISNKRNKATGSTVRLLHNFYPTNILLCKMKVRDDQMCSYCNDIVDYIEHFFFDCPTIKKFCNYIEQYILITFDIQTHLTVVVVLFGIKQHNYGKVKTKLINHVILIAKMCISMHKKPNAILPLSMIFENQLRFRNV